MPRMRCSRTCGCSPAPVGCAPGCSTSSSGRLDAEYGHFRRYTRARLRALLVDAGLEVRSVYSFNLLGVVGWWLAGRQSSGRVGGAKLWLYDLAVPLWRRAEKKLRPRVGLS